MERGKDVRLTEELSWQHQPLPARTLREERVEFVRRENVGVAVDGKLEVFVEEDCERRVFQYARMGSGELKVSAVCQVASDRG